MRRTIIALSLLLCACEKPVAEKVGTSAPPVATSTGAAARRDAPGSLTEPARAGGLTWSAPAPFARRAPKTGMRVAEYGLEGAPQAELGVFYFGADQGGSVEANMTRWIGQFKQPDGSETKAKRSERDVKGIKVSLVEATGTFGGGMAMPGAPAAASIQDAMLLGAIAKGPEGSVFFKLTGPKAAVEGARSAFEGLIESIAVGK